MCVHPFLKWVGGKTQLLNYLLFPKEIDTYYEPFLGGGSVLISLLKQLNKGKFKVKKIEVGDICIPLIETYKLIKYTPDVLIEELEKLCSEKINEKRYYINRKKFNEIKEFNPIKGALFIWINKTCYRGLYRESKNGFNVPYGNYVNPTIFSKENLLNLSRLFNKYSVNFNIGDFSQFHPKEGDFIYLDPPYYPINKTSFIGYHQYGFNKEMNEKLYKFVKYSCLSGADIFMSNSDTEYIKKRYKVFFQKTILAKRAIHSKIPSSIVNELLISSYEY